MPSDSAIWRMVSCRTASYSVACSRVSEQYTFISFLSGRSAMTDAVGLDAAQDERRGQRLEARGGVGVGGALDGQGELAPELLGRAEVARVDHLEDAPQVGQAVLDGRAGHAPPASCAPIARAACAARVEAFLMFCASSSTTPSQLHARQSWLRRGAAASRCSAPRRAAPPRRRALARRPRRRRGAPAPAATAQTAPAHAASCPPPTSDRSPASAPTPRCNSSAINCAVLPSPMSSASRAPRP